MSFLWLVLVATVVAVILAAWIWGAIDSDRYATKALRQTRRRS